jgi:phosphate transport system substrate-binding protein
MRFKFLLIVGLLYITVGCNDGKQQSKTDTPNKGTINISVDESFKPVISEQIKVYRSSFPETNIIATYKSEAECFRDLQKDSTRMIIVARGLHKDELKFFNTNLKYNPLYGILAYDAVAVIVNNKATDSVFTLQDLQKLLSGNNANKKVVVDGTNATSTVRFLLDSVLNGKSFGANVNATANSKAVVDYVANNIDAVGFVGSSWVGNDEDPEQRAVSSKIRLALVECVRCEEKGFFAKPSQATLSYRQYPLVRPLFYVLKENYTGLGTGFMNFMSLERGQLIFRRAYLVPAKMDFQLRSGSID